MPKYNGSRYNLTNSSSFDKTQRNTKAQDMFDYLASLHLENSITYNGLRDKNLTYTELKAKSITYTELVKNGGTLL